MKFKCLLIGGPAHGLVVDSMGAGTFSIPAAGIGVCGYKAENYLCEGRLYRIAQFMPSAGQVASISNLIKETKLPSIAGG